MFARLNDVDKWLAPLAKQTRRDCELDADEMPPSPPPVSRRALSNEHRATSPADARKRHNAGMSRVVRRAEVMSNIRTVCHPGIHGALRRLTDQ